MGVFWVFIGVIVAAALLLGIGISANLPSRGPGRSISRPVHRPPPPVLPPVAWLKADHARGFARG